MRIGDDEKPRVDIGSMASRRLELFAETSSPLGTATGVLLTHQDNVYLVSNWHVLAGRSVYTGEPIHKSAATPTSLAIHLPALEAADTEPIAHVRLVHNEESVARYDAPSGALDDLVGHSTWRQHRTHGRSVDVAAIPLGRSPLLARLALPLTPVWSSSLYVVTDDLRIVGYPDGYESEDEVPIWTRGSVASEPNLDFQGLPRFLVDARTRHGQSGSPVLTRRTHLHNATDTRTGEHWTAATLNEPTTDFIGLYSGRINDDIELGFVWRWEAVAEVITAGLNVAT